MNNIFVRSRRLMRAALVSLLFMAGVTESLAQTQVATLQHGDEITAFYGANAFVQAYNAAALDENDIITLSSGSFVAVNIEKAITLRGAGCAADTEAQTLPTIISGNLSIGLADTLVNHVTVEGILFPNTVTYRNLSYPSFTRCNFKQLDWGWYTSMHDAQFTNCFIEGFNFSNAGNTVFVNCVVWHPYSIAATGRVMLYNSILGRVQSTVSGISAYNSIIINEEGGNTPTAECTFFNCIGINIDDHEAFGNGVISNCTTYTSYAEVFETFAGEFTFEEQFLLTEDAQAFETTDGTEVGIYGGNMPYSNIPFYMVRKRTTVSNRSNPDGTLNVEIEILDEGEGE